MEQQAKERLTGGVILVVLLVLLVPELLTGPRPTPPSPPAQPDQAPMRSYTMELSASPHARAPVAASTSAAPQASEPAAVSSAAEPARVPTDPGSAQSSVAAQPSAAVVPPVLPKVAVRTPPSTPTTPARPAPKPAPAHETEHPAAGWTVQVGTFSSRDNATRVIANLKSHGFSPALSEASRNGHKLFRVRVGAERDKAAAQKLLGRLRAAGEKGGEIVAR